MKRFILFFLLSFFSVKGGEEFTILCSEEFRDFISSRVNETDCVKIKKPGKEYYIIDLIVQQKNLRYVRTMFQLFRVEISKEKR